MAVDYFHRLVVWGAERPVQQFTHDARRRARYRLPGKPVGLTEVIPLSFEALWKRYPQLRQFDGEAPHDPYYVCAWPRRSVRPGLCFVRFQFQTRNMEMPDIARLLSRDCRELVFVLATLCLDTSHI